MSLLTGPYETETMQRAKEIFYSDLPLNLVHVRGMSRKKVPIVHTGSEGGVSRVRLQGDVSGAEKVTSDTLSVLILCL
jgi:hypothetical protein